MKHPRLLLTTLAFGLGLTAFGQISPNTVVDYSPASTKGGGTILAARMNPAMATGMPEDNDGSSAPMNFVSLGFGGSITLRFPSPIGHRDGADDLSIYETTWGYNCSNYPERAQVWVSQTGMAGSWVLAGEGCMNFGVEIPMSLGSIQYVRLLDVSDASNAGFPNDADGYDVDGVVGYTVLPPRQPGNCTGLNQGYGMTVVQYTPGTQKNGAAVPAARRVDTRATGMPQMSDANGQMNFVSLGFDNPNTAEQEGVLVLELDLSFIDDGTPAADMAIFETSWGDAPSHTDASYPERVTVYGSSDGVNWTALNAVGENAALPQGMVVRDARLDLSGMPADMTGMKVVRWLKIVDGSLRSSNKFPGSADGYDVDGVIGVGCLNGARTGDDAFMAEISEGNLALSVSAAPNPVSLGSKLNLELYVYLPGHHSIDLYDLTGKKVQHIADGNFEEGYNVVNWNAAAPSSGLYILRVTGADASQHSATRVQLLD